MKTDLHSRSRIMAQRAIKHFVEGEVDGFFYLAAVAAELLLKARLAEVHPTLIAADRDFDALLHLSGAGGHTKTPPWRIRTIGAREALERCLKIEPTLKLCRLGKVTRACLSKVTQAWDQAIPLADRNCGGLGA